MLKAPLKKSLPPPSGELIRLAVIDDHPLYRDGVVQTLRQSNRFDIVAEGASKQDAIQIAQQYLPDVMLLDVSIPGNGIEAASEITRICPVVKILFLTASENECDVFAGLEAGARGYLVKGISGRELIDMLSAIHRGETIITPGLAGRIMSTMNRKSSASGNSSHCDLTTREDQILEHVARGLTNKEVAIALNLTEKTVKHYMTNIMQKLHVRNRVEAAMLRRPLKPTSESDEARSAIGARLRDGLRSSQLRPGPERRSFG